MISRQDRKCKVCDGTIARGDLILRWRTSEPVKRFNAVALSGYQHLTCRP